MYFDQSYCLVGNTFRIPAALGKSDSRKRKRSSTSGEEEALADSQSLSEYLHRSCDSNTHTVSLRGHTDHVSPTHTQSHSVISTHTHSHHTHTHIHISHTHTLTFHTHIPRFSCLSIVALFDFSFQNRTFSSGKSTLMNVCSVVTVTDLFHWEL